MSIDNIQNTATQLELQKNKTKRMNDALRGIEN